MTDENKIDNANVIVDPSANAQEPKETEPKEGEGQKTLTIEEISSRLQTLETDNNQLRSTNQRLLSESQKYKGDFKKVTEESLRKAKDWDALLKMKEDEIEAERNEKKILKEKMLNKEILIAVGQEAIKRNCPDFDQLLTIGDKTMLRYDPETEEIYGVSQFFDKHQSDSRFIKFFEGTKKLSANTNTPTLPKDPKAQDEEKYRTDPLGYLEELRKKDYTTYCAKIKELQGAGKL